MWPRGRRLRSRGGALSGRELAPNVISIDFQAPQPARRRGDVPGTLATLARVPGSAVDLRRVLAGCTEYGQDWHISLTGPARHLLAAGESGAGKNSVTWRSLVSIAPAIRDGLVRVSGMTPGDGTGLRAGNLCPLRGHQRSPAGCPYPVRN